MLVVVAIAVVEEEFVLVLASIVALTVVLVALAVVVAYAECPGIVNYLYQYNMKFMNLFKT